MHLGLFTQSPIIAIGDFWSSVTTNTAVMNSLVYLTSFLNFEHVFLGWILKSEISESKGILYGKIAGWCHITQETNFYCVTNYSCNNTTPGLGHGAERLSSASL